MSSNTPKDLNGDRIVSAKERRRIVPYSDMHVSRLEKKGEFPRRVRLGANRVGWSYFELQQYIEDKKALRDG